MTQTDKTTTNESVMLFFINFVVIFWLFYMFYLVISQLFVVQLCLFIVLMHLFGNFSAICVFCVYFWLSRISELGFFNYLW